MKKLSCLAVALGVLWLIVPAAAVAQEDPWNPPATGGEEKPASSETAPAAESAPPAVVQPLSYPTAEIDRPLSLPKMMLEPRLNMEIDFFTEGEGENFFSLVPGIGMGVMDRLEAGLNFALALSPDVKAGMDFYGQYELPRMLDNKLFLAGRLRMMIPFSDHYITYWPGAAFALLLDAPAKFKLSDMLALVGGAGLGFSIGRDSGPNFFLLNLEGGALVQPTEALALAVKLGLLAYLGDHSDSLLPLYLDAQYTVIGDLDIWVRFGFLDLTEGADWIQLLFGAGYRFSL